MEHLTPEQKDALKSAVKEAVGSLYRKEAENDFMKDVCKSMKEKVGISPKTFKKLVKSVYKSDVAKLNEEAEEITTLAVMIGAVQEEDN